MIFWIHYHMKNWQSNFVLFLAALDHCDSIRSFCWVLRQFPSAPFISIAVDELLFSASRSNDLWGKWRLWYFFRLTVMKYFLWFYRVIFSSMRMVFPLQSPSQSFLATFKEELDGFVGSPCQIMLMSSSGQKRKG